MFGLALATLYVCYVAVFGSGNLPHTVHDISSFLYYWYIVTGILGFFVCFGTSILSLFCTFVSDTKKETEHFSKVAVFMFSASVAGTFRTIMLWTSSLLLYQASVINPNDWNTWDHNKLIAAGIVGGISLIWSMIASNNKS